MPLLLFSVRQLLAGVEIGLFIHPQRNEHSHQYHDLIHPLLSITYPQLTLDPISHVVRRSTLAHIKAHWKKRISSYSSSRRRRRSRSRTTAGASCLLAKLILSPYRFLLPPSLSLSLISPRTAHEVWGV